LDYNPSIHVDNLLFEIHLFEILYLADIITNILICVLKMNDSLVGE